MAGPIANYDKKVMKNKDIIIDKEEDDLIINNECKKIMRNLCKMPPRQETFDTEATGLTQPSNLSTKDLELFFRTRMFFLLQERHSFLQQCSSAVQQQVERPAEAYASFLSPFYETTLGTSAQLKRPRGRRNLASARKTKQDDAKGSRGASAGQPVGQKISKSVQYRQRPGVVKFLENLRRADTTTTLTLEEKILKSTEGGGYASLLGSNKDTGKVELLLSLFPDHKQLIQDGKDEVSRLDNLVNHVRNRLKYFDRLQLFYESRQGDHTTHEFTVLLQDAVGAREEIAGLIPKCLDQLDEQKIQKLYAAFRDDYSVANTTLIADGTQPVVLDRKMYEKVKKYVDGCADWRGQNVLVPYNTETNFFRLTFPWTRSLEKTKQSTEQVEDAKSE